MKIAKRPFTLLSTILLLTGCDVQLGKQTRGELGRVSFQYDGNGCFWGCGLDTPMMRGTVERLVATMPSATGTVSLSATPGNLAQVTDGASSLGDHGEAYRVVDVSAVDVGDIQLSVTGKDGRLVDRVTASIRDAARLSAQWAKQAASHGPDTDDWSSSPTVPLSGDVYLRLSAYDATGRQLQASRGMTVKVSDERIVAVTQLERGDSWLLLKPLASGTATLTATANPGVSTQLIVRVP
jgi:hypothetical protein